MPCSMIAKVIIIHSPNLPAIRYICSFSSHVLAVTACTVYVYLRVQTGSDPEKDPVTEEPSPMHTLAASTLRKNPSLQV